MVCLGLEPGAAGWKMQTSYGGTPCLQFLDPIANKLEALLYSWHKTIYLGK